MATDIREIDTGTGFDRFARGWHCLGLAEDFRDGRPHAVDAFGTRLVVFADAGGELRVLDGYCRHMGADLGAGTLRDGRVACPFHGWQWDGGTGRCAVVPYAKRTPKLARTRTWRTAEINGQLLVWHDHEQDPPPPDLLPPAIDGFAEGRWSEWAWRSELITGSHCREIVDNNVDMAHFFYIHHAYPTYFKNVLDGQTATQLMHSKAREDIFGDSPYYHPDSLLRSEATYFGPAYMINWLHNDLGEGTTIEVVLTNAHYPVTQDSFVLQWGVAVAALPGAGPGQTRALARAFSAKFSEGFLEDVEVWRHKTRIDNPLLTEEDGPVYQQRRWYEQFYLDKSEVTADMTARYESEIDVRHARREWDAEIQRNLLERR
ncbi:Rieske 2Fe-2S domain-containing protein [Gordonia sp. PP30]|uniref:Rieske 2Fe-2S domain-containing protein n=1 Tax=unclassified Gordonia (in: high G+C Gram-positive bacteria) TaxID=2657482 RepID=UPI002000002C|nr:MULTISPECIES: Rieske 2Fe-2S domain-containing protein [unclassified Gordonia (in: high G+C Gram-positive bacteria)]UQE73638.1 Rieske 2Fe-2S domain-containing protein [Gordonia sp. PP30]